ncbi:hypothetical protein ABG79_02436 [Caloramator mitchellensis]|uniref:Uncharacterized protein n=1 Tax=Caloramator mitchellensis TaxID=908809 RepID=A0A0R3JQS0_CALMK|nr:hypothetical protein [Caloramator mitchellensis]KRQ85793.1 hypothetical protein ABG79_02436 [Caloramator mitchellensis]
MDYLCFKLNNSLFYTEIEEITIFENIYIAELKEKNNLEDFFNKFNITQSIIKDKEESNIAIMFTIKGQYVFSIITSHIKKCNHYEMKNIEARELTVEYLFYFIGAA